jgi:hypothetical protein
MSPLLTSIEAFASPVASLRVMELLCAVSVALQAAENIANLPTLREEGTLRWSVVRENVAHLSSPLTWLLDRITTPPALLGLCLVQLICAAGMVAAPGWWWPMTCFMTSLLFALRWGGSVNGGSDSITLITLACLSIGRGFADEHQVVIGALLYVALQSIASYLIAGLVKLRARRWRDGSALRRFVDGAAVGEPPKFVARVLAGPTAMAASAGVIAFELSAPFALMSPDFALTFIGLAILFHGVNTYLLGLHRFFWAWFATYPAVLFVAIFLR